jgi:hypothetical protein
MIHASTYGKGRTLLHKALTEHLPFKTSGALRGDIHPLPHSVPPLGELDREEADAFRLDAESVGITYVVWSYVTPIAWVRKDGTVYRVQQRFSRTTSKHQGMLYPLG